MDASALNTFYSPAQLQRWREAIPGRYSCRAFSGAPDAGQLSALHYAAQRVCLSGTRIAVGPCPENLFVRVPLVEKIQGATHYACLILDPKHPKGPTLAGISGEAFVLEAQSLGIGTCWVSGTYRRGAVDAPLEDGERVAAVIALGLPKAAEPPARRRKKLSQICQTAPEGWPFWAYQAAEAVRQAPSAVNLQPWTLSYAQRTLRLLGKRADSLDIGIAMLHMHAAAGDLRPHWAWGEGKCAAHLIVEEQA